MTTYRTVTVDFLDIFYREAGDPDAPTILLLHGFPTSSHMFRNLQPSFGAEGAYPYQRDLPDVEFHLLDTEHFALEEEGDAIARYITDFFTRERSQPAFL